jgi:hypothetical protein
MVDVARVEARHMCDVISVMEELMADVARVEARHTCDPTACMLLSSVALPFTAMTSFTPTKAKRTLQALRKSKRRVRDESNGASVGNNLPHRVPKNQKRLRKHLEIFVRACPASVNDAASAVTV